MPRLADAALDHGTVIGEPAEFIPVPHTDSVTSTINYRVPPELASDILAFDGSVTISRTMGELSAALNKDGIEITETRVDAARFSVLLARIADKTISGKIAKEVFEAMWAEGLDADAIIEAKGLKVITDTGAIEKTIDEVMAANPKQLAANRIVLEQESVQAIAIVHDRCSGRGDRKADDVTHPPLH